MGLSLYCQKLGCCTHIHTHIKPIITDKFFLLRFLPHSVGFNLYGCPQIQRAGTSQVSLLTSPFEPTRDSEVLYLKRETFLVHRKIRQTHKHTFPPVRSCSWIPSDPIFFRIEICLCKPLYFKQIMNSRAAHFSFLFLRWKVIYTQDAHLRVCIHVREGEKCWIWIWVFKAAQPETAFSTSCSSASMFVAGFPFKPPLCNRRRHIREGKMKWETRLSRLMCLKRSIRNTEWNCERVTFLFTESVHFVRLH